MAVILTTIWKDEHGCSYKIMCDFSKKYRIHYQKPNRGKLDKGWKPCRSFQTHKTRLEAQTELDNWAEKKDMKIVEKYEYNES